MDAIPTLNFRTQSDYVYTHAWHTLSDTYGELVPYTEHQMESALMTAVVAYGAANLDRPLTRDGVYLEDGLYAEFTIGAGDAPQRFMTTLDFVNAPLQAADFVRIVEGKTGGAGARGGMPGGGFGGPRGGAQPNVPPIGMVDVRSGRIQGQVSSDIQKSVAVPSLPLASNAKLKDDAAGVLGLSGPASFYVTVENNAGLGAAGTALGRTIAGLDLLAKVRKGDPIRSIRVVRVGDAARAFKTDDEAFKKLLEAKK
jgi:peptidylprolyl isomerase